MSRIFISYRRSDSQDTTGRISDYLTNRFGEDRVFQDVDDIAPGVRWDEAIDMALASSMVVLVVIGPTWLTATSQGRRRLEDSDDELRGEVATALRRPDVRVIPVLVGGAELPAEADLPPDLRDLTKRQARTIRGGEHFRTDVAALAERIEPSRPPRRWPWLAATGVAVAAASIATGVALSSRASDPEGPPMVAPVSSLATTSTQTPTATATTSTTVAALVVESDFRTDPLTGTFNVAVLAFRPDPAGNDATAREALNAAEDLRDFLDVEFESSGSLAPALQDVDVGLYERPLPGPDGTIDLVAVAEDLGADLVVTATLRSDPDSRGSSFDPIFAMRGDSFAQDELLAGGFGLGAPAVFQAGFEESAVRAELRQLITRRSCILVHLASGLSLYRSRDDASGALDATSSFDAAASAEGCPAGPSGESAAEGREVAYFFLGNIALLQLDDDSLDLADGWYDRALEVDPSFARAIFGKAEVAFQRINAECRRSLDGPTDIEALRSTRDQYEAAFASYREGLEADRSRVPRLATNARFRKGRVELCLAVAGGTSFDEARSDLGRVVDDYLEAGDDEQLRLHDVAAEAYAGLGFIALHSDDADPAAAVDLLTEAIDLDVYDDGVFLATRAYAYELLGQPDAVAADCAAADDVGQSRCPLTRLDSFLDSFVVRTLALTGFSLWTLTTIGLVLILMGTAVIWLSHRTRSAEH